MRPTSLILRTNPNKKWTKHDHLLVEAYEIFKNELCPQCGSPIWQCHNDTNEIQFHINSEACYAKQAVEKEQKKRTDNKEDLSGIQLRPEAYSTEDKDLIEYRLPFYEERWKRDHPDNPEGDDAA